MYRSRAAYLTLRLHTWKHHSMKPMLPKRQLLNMIQNYGKYRLLCCSATATMEYVNCLNCCFIVFRHTNILNYLNYSMTNPRRSFKLKVQQITMQLIELNFVTKSVSICGLSICCLFNFFENYHRTLFFSTITTLVNARHKFCWWQHVFSSNNQWQH